MKLKEEKKKKEQKEKNENEGEKRKENVASKGTIEKGKEVLITSKSVVKKVLLAQKEPLYSLPTNIFQDIFLKDIPHGLPPINEIEHQIDFTMGATFPNKAVYRANFEERKEI
ncbi:hypothetical protein CR513_30357, partial [Mucuna pruriens]